MNKQTSGTLCSAIYESLPIEVENTDNEISYIKSTENNTYK